MMMGLLTFSTLCPFCLEKYTLDIQLLGRFARCQRCHKHFQLKEVEEKNNKFPSPDFFSGEHQLSIPEVGGDSYEDFLNPHQIREMNEHFPEPLKGGWRAGEILLDGLCQVVPLTHNKLYAEGGVGFVQRVRRHDWNIDLIVKSPKPGVIESEFGKESFERECQTWIELGLHANIVSCYFVRRIDNIPRLFAELAPDGTLRDWIEDQRIYKGEQEEVLARILDIAIQFAWGLEYAHKQGLLHLDVKPSNVMTSGSTIKVTDFGLSKFVTSSSESVLSPNLCDGMTPSYCSPEQFKAFQIYRKYREMGGDIQSEMPPMTKQSDIWSWAISVLAMFHGRSPCKMGGQTAAEVLEVFLKSSLSKTPKVRMPKGMIELLRWCFQKNPCDRPASMQIVADQIVEVYEEELGRKYSRRQPQNTTMNAESFSNRAISLLDLGKTREAVSLLNQAVDLNPHNSRVVFNRTLALWRNGQTTDLQALKQLESCVQNNSSDPSSLYVLGLCNVERGNIKSAITSYEHALEIEPKKVEIVQALEHIKKFEEYDSLCTANFLLKKNNDFQVPPLYIEQKGDFFLLILSDDKIALVKAQTGRIIIYFTRINTTENVVQYEQKEYPQKIAISDDYKWNLLETENGEFVIQSASKGRSEEQQKIFCSVFWGRLTIHEIQITNSVNREGEKNSHSTYLRCEPVHNGLNFVDTQTSELQFVLGNDESSITALATLPKENKGNWLVTGNTNSQIQIWNLSQRRCVRTFIGLGGSVEALWFDPKRRFILSLTKGNCCQYWRTTLICNRSKELRAPNLLCLINSSEELLERQTQIDELIVTADRANKADDLLTLLDIYQNAKKIQGWEQKRSSFVEMLEGNAQKSILEGIIQSTKLQASDSIISTIVSSWDGSFVVTAGKDCILRLWGRPSISSTNTFSNSINPKLPIDSYWKMIREFSFHTDWIRSIDMSPDNLHLISGSWDQSVAVWNLCTGKKIRVLPERYKGITHTVFAPDGRTVAVTTTNGSVSLWDSVTNSLLVKLVIGSGYVRAFKFSFDGTFFITVTDEDNIVRFWTGRSEVPFWEIGGFTSKILTLDLSIDNSTIAVGCMDGRIHILILDIQNNVVVSKSSLTGHLGEITSLKLFSNSQWLASVGKDKMLKFWDLRRLVEIKTITNVDGEYLDIALDYSGSTVFTSSSSGIIQRWNLLWDYEIPSEKNIDTKRKKGFISSLARHNILINALYKKQLKPSDYYGLSLKNPFLELDSSIMINSGVFKKIYREMRILGFGKVTLQEIENTVING